ncbi:MAG: GNAT family N-acetyltransferase [Lewinellaceae bacterium]|nr:GNAT family N-acetyltransferase [Saprospiraceae bacterium]MCB9333854.1 GNAT family N-acetyltransferase [Lewinellaceae bacterium]
MIRLVRTDSGNPDFIALVKLLDAELAIRDGDDHAFYDQFNKIDMIKNAVVVYENDRAIACGALKAFQPGAMEIKRMYTLPDHRGKGVASAILAELEHWTADLSYEKCVLETGINQPEAIALYKKSGYRQIPNYGQYTGVETSLCFEKRVRMVE